MRKKYIMEALHLKILLVKTAAEICQISKIKTLLTVLVFLFL